MIQEKFKAVYVAPNGTVEEVDVFEHGGRVRVVEDDGRIRSVSSERLVLTSGFADFEREVRRTAATTAFPELDLAVACMGLAGESGEVCDYLKKSVGHGHDTDVEKVKKELGDVLWYVSRIAQHFGLGLEDVARANVVKLRTRYPSGFSTAASKARVDVKV